MKTENKVKNTKELQNNRLGKLREVDLIIKATKITLSLTVATTISFGGYFLYETKSREAALKTNIEGLDEYELCQYTYEKFGMKGVEEIGCTHTNQ